VSVFVIIPVHNRLHFTHACLRSLREQSYRDFTTVVVDAGSTDRTSDVLAKEFPTVRMLSGDGSLWWTAAMNIGVGWALAHAKPHDVVLSLNNDTVLPSRYLERLVQAHTVAPRALIGSLQVSAADRKTIVDGGVTLDWATARYRSAGRGDAVDINEEVHPSLRRVDVLSGCGTLIPVRVFHRIGAYDEVRLPHYAADYEFSRRALRAGFGLFVDWDSPLFLWEAETGIHGPGVSTGCSGLLRSFWDIRSAHDFRNRWRFAVAACPRWALPTYVPCDYARVVIGSIRRYRSREHVGQGTPHFTSPGFASRMPSNSDSGQTR